MLNRLIACMQARKICRTWLYERSVSAPANLYDAQYARRMRRLSAAAAPKEQPISDANSTMPQ
jgi:hypothetical protein